MEEAEQIGLDMSVSYPWAKDFGLLAKISVTAKYLYTGHNYVAPTQPPDMDPDMLIPSKTQIQIKIMQSATIVANRNYAVVSGFRRGVCDNFRDALEPRYYEQMYEDIFKYKRVLPRRYIEHLELKWVILDEVQIEKMIGNYKRGWSQEEHFTTFAKRLSREQKKLKSDNIIISDADKKQHLMIQVWDRDLFDRAVMNEWNERPNINKSFDHAVAYFTKQLAAIESFEAAGGGASKKQGYESTNAATEFQAACVAEIQQNRAATDEENKVMATAFTGAIAEQQAEIKSLREILASIENKMTTRTPRTPPRQRRREEVTPPRRERRHYESDSETEPESPPDRTQEAYDQKRKQSKKATDQRKKREKASAAARRTASAAAKSSARPATSGGLSFKKGGDYEPGMRFNKEWDRRTKSEFLKVRGRYHATGTKAAKSDRAKSIRQMLEDAEADE